MVAVTVAAQVVTRLAGARPRRSGQGGLLTELLRIVVPLVVATVVVMLLYRFVPARRLRSGDAVVGIVTGLLLLAISAASAFVYDKVAGLSVVYGSITALLVFLYSVYLYASALLFGGRSSPRRGRRRPTWVLRADQGPGSPCRPAASSSGRSRRPTDRPRRGDQP
jgi:uncharacterized BrkB/YihY/UPF0761 family membrane protein